MGIFNTLYSVVGDVSGMSFLDMFGGSGIIGLEAISRGFGEVTVFEINSHAANIIKKNYNSLGLTPNLVIGDSLKLIKQTDKIYDVVYIDPPYKSDIYEKILPYVCGKLIIVESSEVLDFKGFDVIKQKKYGNSIISYIQKSVL